MAYRHHSLRCRHRVQNTQGSNEYQLRITCQECQGHLAIVYGRHLNVESRRLIQEHLRHGEVLSWEAARPRPVQRQQPRARAAAPAQKPQDEPERTDQPEEDPEIHRARVILTIAEMNREIRRLTAELEGLPQPAAHPPQAGNPPETEQEQMPRAQERPQQ